jgi:hypothetical protein
VPWNGRDCLLDALGRAQSNTYAWPERIIIVRGSEPQLGGHVTTYPSSFDKKKLEAYTKTGVQPETSEHPRHVMVINLMAMIEKGDLSNNVFLLPNDVIYVQPNPFARMELAMQSLLGPVRPVLEATRVPASVTGTTFTP